MLEFRLRRVDLGDGTILWAWSLVTFLKAQTYSGSTLEGGVDMIKVPCAFVCGFFETMPFFWTLFLALIYIHAFVVDTWDRNQTFCKNPPGFLLNHHHYGLFRKHQQIFGTSPVWVPWWTSWNPKLLSKNGIQLVYLHLSNVGGRHGAWKSWKSKNWWLR